MNKQLSYQLWDQLFRSLVTPFSGHIDAQVRDRLEDHLRIQLDDRLSFPLCEHFQDQCWEHLRIHFDRKMKT